MKLSIRARRKHQTLLCTSYLVVLHLHTHADDCGFFLLYYTTNIFFQEAAFLLQKLYFTMAHYKQCLLRNTLKSEEEKSAHFSKLSITVPCRETRRFTIRN